MSLESLPVELAVDAILATLSNKDLCRARLVSRGLRRLADDASLWRRRVARDFRFPIQSTSRVLDWRELYVGLREPELWACGGVSVTGLCLGLPSMSDTVYERRSTSHTVWELVHRYMGVPFPLEFGWAIDYTYVLDSYSGFEYSELSARVIAGTPMELYAGKGTIYALTSTGYILAAGEAFDVQFHVPYAIDLDRYLHGAVGLMRPLGGAVKLMTCSSTFTIVTTDQRVFQWTEMTETPSLIRMTGVFDAINTATSNKPSRRIVQLTSDTEYTTILTAPSASSNAEDDDTADSSYIYIWYYSWTRLRTETNEVGTRIHSPGIERLDGEWSQLSHSVRLPALPDPPGDLAATLLSRPSEGIGVDEEVAVRQASHKRIVHIAAGANTIYALTASGLLYRLDVQRPRAPTEEEEEEEREEEEEEMELLTLLDAVTSRSMLEHDFKTGQRSWVLLRGFCDPAMIEEAGSDVWLLPGKQSLVDRSTRIKHISASGEHFVAYSFDKDASNTAKNGIVLLGTPSHDANGPPTILPHLQGTGIVKIDWGPSGHWGSLDVNGRLRTWGTWSHGARGTWDSLPPDPYPSSSLGQEAVYKPWQDESDEIQERRCRPKQVRDYEDQPRKVKFFRHDEDVDFNADFGDEEEGNADVGGRFCFDFVMEDGYLFA